MRDKLRELITTGIARYFIQIEGNNKNVNEAEVIADYLIDNNVVVLPCKIGQTVYDASEFFDGLDYPDIYELEDKEMTIEKVGNDRYLFDYDGIHIFHDNIGVTQFFSREEAEKAINYKIADQAATWERNLEGLQNGMFGEIATYDEATTNQTMLNYWQAQERAGYPYASENVKYFEEQLRCSPVRDLSELIKTIEAEMENER